MMSPFHREQFVWLTEPWSEIKVDLNATKTKEIVTDSKENIRELSPITVMVSV